MAEGLTVLAEGRIAAIEVTAAAATTIEQFDPADSTSPVVLTVEGERGFYIRIYDHRVKVVEAYRQYLMDRDLAAFDDAFACCPCLGRFGVKKGQYIALADLGTPDMSDSGEEHPLILTRGGQFNRDVFRVVVANGRPALHLATKLCFVEERPPKEAVEEAG